MKDYTAIGYTKKLYGTKGGIRVFIEEDRSDDFKKRQVLFLNIDGRKIPYFIHQIIDAPPLRVIFEDHTDRDTAQALTGKEIFIPTKTLQPAPAKTVNLSTLEGFLVTDSLLGVVGPILEIQEFPQQLMAVITYQDKEILLPLNENLIDRIEMDSQTIFVSLPEGLLEL